MSAFLRIELARAFKRKWFIISLIIGLSIALYNFFADILPYALQLDGYMKDFFPSAYPGNLYTSWLGGGYSTGTYYFFLIFPLLAAIPFSDTLFTDAKSGFIQNLCIRGDKRSRYFTAKYIATFCSGGAAVVIPLIFSFCLGCLVYPLINPEPTTNTSLLGDLSTFPYLYYYLPLLYVLIFIVINFIYGGLYACFGLLSTFYVNYRFLVLIMPFLLHLFLMTLLPLAGLAAWVPMNFLQPSYPEYTLYPLIIEALLLFVLTFWRVVLAGSKNDIY